MSAHFPQEQFSLIGADSPNQAAAMWRGAMIDRFARLEAAALHCLLVAKSEKGEEVTGAYIAWQRFSLLRTAIALSRFSTHAKRLHKLLDSIDELHELRTALAHGMTQKSRTGIELSWHSRSGKQWGKHRIKISWLEALDHLVRVDKLAHEFSSQTGQIRKLCSRTS